LAKFDPTSASRAVLIEVANVLGAYRDHIVLIGGWVPELLYPNRGHVGSIDVDIAVASTALAPTAYETILKRMQDAGYVHQFSPTRFLKTLAGVEAPVKVDVISGEYGSGAKTAAIAVNELQLTSLRGVDLAFEASEVIEISGTMPDGAENVVHIRIARPEVFVLIKAFALEERAKEKDAYDIAFVLQQYEPSLATLAERIRPHILSGLGREAYGILQRKFATINSVGPVWAAEVLAEHNSGTDETGTGVAGISFEQAQRDVYESAQELFRFADRR
jgi:predicted nucleotidyltransferase